MKEMQSLLFECTQGAFLIKSVMCQRTKSSTWSTVNKVCLCVAMKRACLCLAGCFNWVRIVCHSEDRSGLVEIIVSRFIWTYVELEIVCHAEELSIARMNEVCPLSWQVPDLHKVCMVSRDFFGSSLRLLLPVWAFTSTRRSIVEKNPTNVISASFQYLAQQIWTIIWRYIVEENPTNVTTANWQPLKQPIWEFIYYTHCRKAQQMWSVQFSNI